AGARRALLMLLWRNASLTDLRIDAGVAQGAVRIDALVAQQAFQLETEALAHPPAGLVQVIDPSLDAPHAEFVERKIDQRLYPFGDQAVPLKWRAPPIAELAARHVPVDAVQSAAADHAVAAL